MRKNNKKEMLNKIDKKLNTFLGKYTLIIIWISLILYAICCYEFIKYGDLAFFRSDNYNQYQKEIWTTYFDKWMFRAIIFGLLPVVIVKYDARRHIRVYFFGKYIYLNWPLN